MASPFAVFRRNQRVMLAIVAISAMVAFVFLDPVMKYVGGRSRRAENPVVVETKYGALTHVQLENMKLSRDLVDRFLRNVIGQTVLAQINKGLIDPRSQAMAEMQIYNFWKQALTGRSTDAQEQAAVETLVLSKRAEQLGMVISDRAINDLIKQITDESLSSETLQAIIRDLQGGRRKLSVTRLFDCIRTEMLASKLSNLFYQSLRDVPPAQRFEYYESLNRKVKAEVLPLAVAGFVGQVAEEPTAEQLRALYDAHKNQYPDPASPEPGFKQPKRASFQYFKADFAKFRDEFKPQVTDQEIAEYYEQNKAQFRAVELPSDKDAKPESAAPDEPASSDQQPKDESAKESIEDQPSKPEDKPADDDSGAKSGNEAPQSKGAEGKSDASQKAPADSAPQARRLSGTLRLVSATTSSAEGAEGAPPTAAAEEKAAESDKPGEGPATEKEAAQAASEDKPAERADEAESPATTPAAEIPEAETPKESIRYEPLEKVKDTIRDSIAANKARERIATIFGELQAAMRHYSDERAVDGERKGQAAKAPFPLEELAKSKNVEAKALDQVSADEAAETDLGQVQRTVRRSQFDFRNVPLADFAFADSFVTYKPEVGSDAEGNEYLFWKTDEKPAYVPALDQIRDKVVLAWKMTKARELARKRAEELATQARVGDKPMAETFAGQSDLKVTETKSFSWMTTGSVPFDPSGGQPRISQVEGVERPGDQFMKTVFSLSPGEVGVAMNEPQDTAYVVRLVEYDRPLEELRNDFATEPAMRYMGVADKERRAVYLAWLVDLNRAADVHWVRPADSASARAARDESPSEDADF